jgi:hypothetical protein
MTTKQVTAQDFLDAIDMEDIGYGHCDGRVRWDETLVAFDALLSQARQEAVEEYKAFMRSKLSGLQDDSGKDISRHFQ